MQEGELAAPQERHHVGSHVLRVPLFELLQEDSKASDKFLLLSEGTAGGRPRDESFTQLKIWDVFPLTALSHARRAGMCYQEGTFTERELYLDVIFNCSCKVLDDKSSLCVRRGNEEGAAVLQLLQLLQQSLICGFREAEETQRRSESDI